MNPLLPDRLKPLEHFADSVFGNEAYRTLFILPRYPVLIQVESPGLKSLQACTADSAGAWQPYPYVIVPDKPGTSCRWVQIRVQDRSFALKIVAPSTNRFLIVPDASPDTAIGRKQTEAYMEQERYRVRLEALGVPSSAIPALRSAVPSIWHAQIAYRLSVDILNKCGGDRLAALQRAQQYAAAFKQKQEVRQHLVLGPECNKLTDREMRAVLKGAIQVLAIGQSDDEHAVEDDRLRTEVQALARLPGPGRPQKRKRK